MNEQIKNLTDSIQKLNTKDFGIYFFTIDSKGNPNAGVANIYEHVKTLRELGFNAQILHEKNDYKLYPTDPDPQRPEQNYMSIAEWLGYEYTQLPHISIESKQLNVNGADFVVIPEAFASIMKEVKNFPCKRIVFLQSYEYVFETLEMGETWASFGINEVVTTTQTQKNYIDSLFTGLNTQIVPVTISDTFKTTTTPKEPTVAVSVRDPREMLKLIKAFYTKYPHYKFVSFRDMRGMSKTDFAQALSKCFTSIWIDDISGFGTFPLESMKTETIVIGKIPRMVPEWMGTTDQNGNINLNENGVWTSNINALHDVLATMVGLYLEDSLPQSIIDGMKEYSTKYTSEETKTAITEVYTNIFNRRIEELTFILKQTEEKLSTETQELTEETK